MALGVGEEGEAGLVERAAQADAGEDILQRAALGDVIVDIVGGDEGDLEIAREVGEFFEVGRIFAVVEAGGGQREGDPLSNVSRRSFAVARNSSVIKGGGGGMRMASWSS